MKSQQAAPSTTKLPGVTWLKLADIQVEAQVRKTIDPETIQELAEDIRAHGLLQPILVRRNGTRYTVIAGHRRRFACELAGLSQVPAIVGEASADDVLEIQLAENLQREDLQPQEIGAVLTQLYAKHASLDTVALIVNKSKSWVAKHIKFTNTSWRAHELFEEGVSEDIELLNALSDLYSIDITMATDLEKELREGKLNREHVRHALAEAKAKRAAERVPTPTQKKRPTQRARTLPQMCSEIEFGRKPIAEIIKAWTDNERKLFLNTAEKSWAEGRKTKHSAAALTQAALAYEKAPFKVARLLGFLAGENPKTGWADVQDAYVKELQAFRDRDGK